MGEEPDQANYGYIYFYPLYSGDVVRSKELPATDKEEAMWSFWIRPHKSMRHICAKELSKIPYNDSSRRYGEYIKVKYPLRLREIRSSDPSHFVWYLNCDFNGNEAYPLGLDNLGFQLREAMNRINNLKMQMAIKDKIIDIMSTQMDLIAEIRRTVKESVSQEVRLILLTSSREKREP